LIVPPRAPNIIIEMNTPTQIKSFVRVITSAHFKSLVKEARRVKYIVKGRADDLVIVKDDETGEEVFSGMPNSTGEHYVTSFNTQYWQYPAFPA